MDREAGNKFNQWVHRAILGDEFRNRRVGKLKDTGARQDKGAPVPFCAGCSETYRGAPRAGQTETPLPGFKSQEQNHSGWGRDVPEAWLLIQRPLAVHKHP